MASSREFSLVLPKSPVPPKLSVDLDHLNEICKSHKRYAKEFDAESGQEVRLGELKETSLKVTPTGDRDSSCEKNRHVSMLSSAYESKIGSQRRLVHNLDINSIRMRITPKSPSKEHDSDVSQPISTDVTEDVAVPVVATKEEMPNVSEKITDCPLSLSLIGITVNCSSKPSKFLSNQIPLRVSSHKCGSQSSDRERLTSKDQVPTHLSNHVPYSTLERSSADVQSNEYSTKAETMQETTCNIATSNPGVETSVNSTEGTGSLSSAKKHSSAVGQTDTVRQKSPHEEICSTENSSPCIRVNGKRYKVIRELGRGGSSTVHEVYDDRMQLVAIKCVDLKGTDKAVHDGYLNEINMLKKLQGSSRIIKLHDHEYSVQDGNLYVVMERGDVDLATLIKLKMKQGGITPEMVKFYWSEMLRAVQEIHCAGIIHFDLKPANFLLVAGQLKLIDFGIASAIPDDRTSITKDTKCGTPNYMSPEALMDIQDLWHEEEESVKGARTKLRTKSDVWSLGCILYHMVYGVTPFQHIRNHFKIQAIVCPTFEIKFPAIRDKLLLDVLKKCIERDSQKRASVGDLLKHPYLNAASILDYLQELSPSSAEKASKFLEHHLRNQNQPT